MQLKWLEVTNTPHYRAWRHCKPAHPSTVTCIELKTLRVTSLVVSTRCVVPGTTIQDAVYRMYIVVRCNSLLWKEEYVGIALQSRIMIHFIEAFLILWLYSCWRGLCSCLRRRSVHLLRTTPALGNVEDKCTESRGLIIIKLTGNIEPVDSRQCRNRLSKHLYPELMFSNHPLYNILPSDHY